MNLPPEIIELDAKISELQKNRKEMLNAFLNAMSPFKTGDAVKFQYGRTTYDGTVMEIIPSGFRDYPYHYVVQILRKNGGTQRVRVTAWETNKIKKDAP